MERYFRLMPYSVDTWIEVVATYITKEQKLGSMVKTSRLTPVLDVIGGHEQSFVKR